MAHSFNMYLECLLICSVIFVAANAQPSAQARSRLFSSAFGVPGLNASYDYVGRLYSFSLYRPFDRPI